MKCGHLNATKHQPSEGGGKSSFFIAVICITSRRIPVRASTNQVAGKGGLIPLWGLVEWRQVEAVGAAAAVRFDCLTYGQNLVLTVLYAPESGFDCLTCGFDCLLCAKCNEWRQVKAAGAAAAVRFRRRRPCVRDFPLPPI